MGLRKKKGTSILRQMLTPMLVAMLLQTGLFSVNMIWGGTVGQLDRNSFDILNERVINRKNDLENEMLQRWSNLTASVEAITEITEREIYAGGADLRDLGTDSALSRRVLDESADQLIYLIRRNMVTGAFLILDDGAGAAPPPGRQLERPGVYIRDLDPVASTNATSDLLLEVAPAQVSKRLSISLDTRWSPWFRFAAGDEAAGRGDYFFEPMRAAREYPQADIRDLGYWCRRARLDETDIEVITYSVPLRDSRGRCFGVLGVELSNDYLRSLMPYSEINGDKRAAYMLAVSDGGGTDFETVVSSGPLYKQLFNDGRLVACEPDPVYGNSYRVRRGERMQDDVYACVQPFVLYNSNTPFEQEQWVLIGLIERGTLFEFSGRVRLSVLLALALSLALGVLGAWVAGRGFSSPITALVRKVREINPHRPVVLEQVGVSEIDELSSAIEGLSHRVSDAASKLSRIIRLADVPVAAFEYRRGEERVQCTDGFFRIFGMEDPGLDQPEIAIGRFRELMDSLTRQIEESGSGSAVYRLARASGEPFWVRLKVVDEGERVLGVASDITQETIEKRKIERERDYDLLTNLLNRRAFDAQIQRLFRDPQRLGVAALVMLDLDNLKYINDTYGHDYGDEYIRCAANVLKRYTPYNTMVSRMSGDEFHVFFYGYQSREEVRALIAELRDGMRETNFPLPDNKSLRVRASAGVAWYPDDTQSCGELMRYADFAMYKVKNTTKGEFTEFDLESYRRDSYLLRNKEELNRLIDEELVDYFFQPIVDAATAEIFALEALMRPTIDTIKNPLEVLTLARSQSKLYQIEQLTWRCAPAAFQRLRGLPRDCRLFINSIANQMLTVRDIDEVEARFGSMLHRVVVEVTEEERQGEDCTRFKLEIANRWGAQVALDDFGTGYNSDVALLSINPDFVKIDMSIVRGIDADPNRRKILQNLVSYSHSQGIKVIAEGMETHAELETLIENEVDYLQGYYVARPSVAPEPLPPELRAEILSLHRKYFAGKGEAKETGGQSGGLLERKPCKER